MSIFGCHKQEPQPWMSYISRNQIRYSGVCCPQIVTDTTHLLPFQIISEGDYIRSEISVYGSGVWTEITLTIDTVYAEGFYIHSYNGAVIDALPCGVYEFRVIAGETWWFEPIMVQVFTIDTTTFTKKDILMVPLKFAETELEGIPLIAPCDSFLPFMYATANSTSGSVTINLTDTDGNVTDVTAWITVDVLTIEGKTYYIYDGACFYPFIECDTYRLSIVDGSNTYYSVLFSAVCNISDIPDGYRPMLDMNRCVMRDTEGDIMYESCTGQPNILYITVGDTATNEVIIYFDRNIDTFSVPDNTDFDVRFSGASVVIAAIQIFTDGDGNSTTVTIILNRSILSTESGELDYTLGTVPIISLDDSMPIGSFYNQHITNNV